MFHTRFNLQQLLSSHYCKFLQLEVTLVGFRRRQLTIDFLNRSRRFLRVFALNIAGFLKLKMQEEMENSFDESR